MVRNRIGLGNIVDALSRLRILFDRDRIGLRFVKYGEGDLEVLNELLGPSDFRLE